MVAELVCRSSFSLLHGASHPDELVAAAVARGLSALAITDRDGVYGLPQAHRAAREAGLALLCGATVTVSDAASVALIAEDVEGWARLCRLLSDGRAAAPKGRARVDRARLCEAAGGLTAILLDGWTPEVAAPVAEAFGDRLEIGWTRTMSPSDRARLRRAEALEAALRRPLVATHDVVMHDPSRRALADVLTAIRRRVPVDRLGRARLPNAARTLLDPASFAAVYAARPDAVARTVEVAARCAFRLSEVRYAYPREVVPDGSTPLAHLTTLTWQGAQHRFPEGVPASVERAIVHELGVIEQMDVPSYFLTVHDVVAWARARGILCQGRGSAANSAVCYCLGITSVDPARSSLLFERFLSPERGEPPDIDVDFEHERREEVLQYVYARYGRDRAAMVNEIIAYRPRSAVRDVGTALGLGRDVVDRLAGACGPWSWTLPDDLDAEVGRQGVDTSAHAVRTTLRLAAQLCGFPRHLGIHSGGFVISEAPLVGIVPVESATMEGRTVVQWDKYGLEALGLVKVDLLSLGMLTAIRKAFDLIAGAYGTRWALHTVPAEDPAVYRMFQRADTVGVFQIESRAQQSMLPRLKPRCFYDLVIEVAIVRPGPIQGGMVHPYLARRNGEEPVTYAHPALEPILARTLGVPLFQEQVMAMAVAVGGFTPGQADQLRRAMGAWRKTGNLAGIGAQLVENMKARGIDGEYADRILEQIKGFGEYGFPESHAASFALLVYVSGWLRCHHPEAFCAALINSQPMGFYAPRTLVADAQRHGVEVRPIDVQASDWDCTLEPAQGSRCAIRLGLRLVRGLREADAQQLVAARAAGPFADLPDVARRTGLPTAVLQRLAEAEVFRSLVPDRRRAAWILQGLWTDAPLFAGLARAEPDPALRREGRIEALATDYRTVGLAVDDHPAAAARALLAARGMRPVPLVEVVCHPPDAEIVVLGLIGSRQRPGTAKGVTFLSLEDETGMLNVVVWRDRWAAHRDTLRAHPVVVVRGRVQRAGEAVSLLLDDVAAVHAADAVHAPGRDFR